jgi:F-type H+-transporting ATPase subunit b
MITRVRSVSAWMVVWLLVGSLSANAFEGADKGHDHYDPTHGYASANSDSLLDFKSDKALFTGLVFLLLCGGLYLAAWKPISQALERRETTIANQIADAQRASEEAGAKLKEYEAKLADAAVKAQEMVVAAKRDAEGVAERIKTEAQADATRMLDRAKNEIESAKQAALSELTTKSTDLAFGLARRVIGREINAGDHQKLISEALGRLPSGN